MASKRFLLLILLLTVTIGAAAPQVGPLGILPSLQAKSFSKVLLDREFIVNHVQGNMDEIYVPKSTSNETRLEIWVKLDEGAWDYFYLAGLPDRCNLPTTSKGLTLSGGIDNGSGGSTCYSHPGHRTVHWKVRTGTVKGHMTIKANVSSEASFSRPLLPVTDAVGSAGIVAAILALGKAIVSLFTRLTEDDALQGKTRQALLDAIRAHPGIHYRALARQAGLGASTVRYHVRVLLRHGHVVQRRQGKQRCLFENHGRYGDEWAALVALRDPDLGRLHGWVRGNPGASRSAAARHALAAWGWGRSNTYHRIRRLVECGLLGEDGGALVALDLPPGKP